MIFKVKRATFRGKRCTNFSDPQQP